MMRCIVPLARALDAPDEAEFLMELCDAFDTATVVYKRYPSKKARSALIAVARDIKTAYFAL